MLLSQSPTKFVLPFAQNAGAQYVRDIPVNSQIGVQAGAASLNDGFPPANFLPVSAGGTPPFGQDFNGLLRQITANTRWFNAGGPVFFDAAFAAAIGGYPRGSVVASATQLGIFFRANIDGVTSDPDVSAAPNWTPFGQGVGSWMWGATDDVVPGYLKANGTSVGSALSGATQLADNVLAWPIYNWSWLKFSQAICPVFGGRGVSALLDFQANKPIALLDLRGFTIEGSDAMGSAASGRLNSVPVLFGNPSFASAIIGENLHALIAVENGPHGHGTNDPSHFHNTSGPLIGQYSVGGSAGPGLAGNGTSWASDSKQTGITIQANGNGQPHNTVQLAFTGTHYLKYWGMTAS